MDILTSGNRFSSKWKLSRKLVEANFKRKSIFQLMKTDDFLTSEYHFLPFSQTAVKCYQWKQFFLQLEHIFQPILHSG